MIQIKVINVDTVVAALGEKAARVDTFVAEALGKWAVALVEYIKTQKLSGSPLRARSGALRSSVHPTGTTLPGQVSAGAGAGAGVPYARIHELGGLIPAHLVVARNARALAIPLATGLIFRKWARIPAVNMPQRSYMVSSLEEMAPAGIEAVKLAVKEAMMS